MSLAAPLLRVFEKIASTCEIVRLLIGLSLWTNTASMSSAVLISVGLYAYFFSKSSSSWSFIGRLIGPKFAVPATSAVGAVPEPLPSISTVTLG